MDVYSKKWVTDELQDCERLCNSIYPRLHPQLVGLAHMYHMCMARRRWLLKQLLRIQLRDFNHM